MGWGQRWPERQPRPAVQKLANEQKLEILTALNKGIEDSPVLSALKLRARSLRGRFYIERLLPASARKPGFEVFCRMTPLVGTDISLLLEVGNQRGNWREIAIGTARELLKTIVEDKKGTFHGLGILDKSIRKARKKGLARLEVARKESFRFVYSEKGTRCTVQEVLVHFVAYNMSYGEFSGTCLYAVVGGKWQALKIKPNQSGSISDAMTWLEKRKWQGW